MVNGASLLNFHFCPGQHWEALLAPAKACRQSGEGGDQALGTFFRGKDAAVVFYREWVAHRDIPLVYRNGNS